MGRPREHDDKTRSKLRAAAEQILNERGVGGLSVRAVAEAAGTTTRAIYTLFGSKEGLLIDALAEEAYRYLADEVAALPDSGDPVEDLVEVGVKVFRSLVLEHPALYRVAFQRVMRGFRAGPEVTAVRQRAWEEVLVRVRRLEDAGLLGTKTVNEAAVEFNAMMEGLANAELRGAVLANLPPGDEERYWRAALNTVIRGYRDSATGSS